MSQTNYKINLVDLNNIFTPLIEPSYSLIPSSSGLPLGIYSSCCAMNGNGNIMIIGAGSVSVFTAYNLYYSTNYGVTWNITSGVPASYWTCVSCSQSGQYIAAGTWQFATIGAVIYVSSNYGSSWTTIPSLPTNPTGGIPVNYGYPISIKSISINNSGLLLVTATYSNTGSPYKQLLFYTNNLSTWYLQQLQGYSNTSLLIPSCKISNSSTSIFTPQFMCCVSQYISGYTGGIWIYTISNPIWSNYGSSTGLYQSIDISNDGQYGVIGINNSVSSPLYLSSDYCQTWTVSSSPNTTLIANVCINSTGTTICYNNFIISYNYGNTWNILTSIPFIPIWLSLSYNSNYSLIVSIDGYATTTGCYIYKNLNPLNSNTNYLVNGTDLSLLYSPQLVDPSNSYVITNYKVKNYMPLWTTINGTYDLGQIFDISSTFFILSGTYSLTTTSTSYTITFSTPENASLFVLNGINISYFIVGSGAGGSSGTYGSTGGSGGRGGGGGQVLQGNFISSNNCLINLVIGAGGLGTIVNPSGPFNGNISSLIVSSQFININALGGSINNSQGTSYNTYNGGSGGGNGNGGNGTGGILGYGGGGGGGGGGNGSGIFPVIMPNTGGNGVNGGAGGGNSGTSNSGGQSGGFATNGGGGGGGGSQGLSPFTTSPPGGGNGGNGIIILTIPII